MENYKVICIGAFIFLCSFMALNANDDFLAAGGRGGEGPRGSSAPHSYDSARAYGRTPSMSRSAASVAGYRTGYSAGSSSSGGGGGASYYPTTPYPTTPYPYNPYGTPQQ